MARSAITWQSVHAEALRRIQARIWAPGALIPNEVELAEEFGCARATVNRALQELAQAGSVIRRRKAGTRVAETPERRARFSISVISEEIAARGETPNYQLLAREEAEMPPAACEALGLKHKTKALHIRALYLAASEPYVLEDRWVNTAAVPAILEADLAKVSANEWLLRHAAFDHGTLEYSAIEANKTAAQRLACKTGAALMCLVRTTHSPTQPITWVKLTYAPGYKLQMEL